MGNQVICEAATVSDPLQSGQSLRPGCLGLPSKCLPALSWSTNSSTPAEANAGPAPCKALLREQRARRVADGRGAIRCGTRLTILMPQRTRRAESSGDDLEGWRGREQALRRVGES